MKFKSNNEEAAFDICKSMKQSCQLQLVSVITNRVDICPEVKIQVRQGVAALLALMMNFKRDINEKYDEFVVDLDWCEYRLMSQKLDLDKKNRESLPMIPFVEETPKIELKALNPHLRYAFLGQDETHPDINTTNLGG